jgi:hypothetical protein
MEMPVRVQLPVFTAYRRELQEKLMLCRPGCQSWLALTRSSRYPNQWTHQNLVHVDRQLTWHHSVRAFQSSQT